MSQSVKLDVIGECFDLLLSFLWFRVIDILAVFTAERPKASIVLLTGWSEVFSTDSLVLKCEVMESTDVWNYTW